MPSPDLIIWGLIAIAAVLLWPIRNWMRRRHDPYGLDSDDED